MDQRSLTSTSSDSQPSDAVMSPLFLQRDLDLTSMRRALVSFGRAVSLFSDDRRTYPGLEATATTSEFLENASVEELIGTINNRWEPDTHERQFDADPWGIEAQQLRSALLEFAAAFGLLDCDCVRRPACIHGEAERLNPKELLELIDELWHGRAGCLQHLPTDSDVHVVERQIAENLALIGALVPRLRVWPDALARYRQIRATRWYREVRHLSDHSIDAWMPAIHEHAVTRAALFAAQEIARGASWGEQDASDYADMLADVFAGVLTHRIAADEVWRALYDAIEPNVPMSELRLALSA